MLTGVVLLLKLTTMGSYGGVALEIKILGFSLPSSSRAGRGTLRYCTVLCCTSGLRESSLQTTGPLRSPVDNGSQRRRCTTTHTTHNIHTYIHTYINIHTTPRYLDNALYRIVCLTVQRPLHSDYSRLLSSQPSEEAKLLTVHYILYAACSGW